MVMKRLLIIMLLIFAIGCVPEVKDTEQLNIDFYQQKGPSCVPAQVLMALKYYYPEGDYNLEMIDEMIGRKADKWTWFSQALPVLVNEGLDAYYYSMTPYEDLTPEFVIEFYGDEDGEVINRVTDWEELNKSIEYLKTTDSYEFEQLEWEEVENAFFNGNIILMIIDINVAKGNDDLPYAGHGVIITKINETDVVFHNSQGIPNTVITKEKFVEAWNAPGTDNDIILIKGKK